MHWLTSILTLRQSSSFLVILAMIREGKSGLGFKDGFVGSLIEAQSKLNGVEIIEK